MRREVAPRADDAAVAEAKARFEEGLELADKGQPEPARLKFQQAWAVFKAPAVLYNLARSEQLTGHDLEALEHFRLFAKVSATDAKITDAMREKAKQNAAELSAKVAQVDIEVPASARVTVDGKALEESPPKEPVPVQPGRHRIEATFEGKLQSVTVDCTRGAVTKAKIVFEPGGITEPPPETREPNSAHWVVPTVLGVVGLAGIGLGVGFGLKSQSNKSSSEDIRSANPGLCANPPLDACSDYDSKRSSAKSAATVSTISYVAGGVFLAGALVTYFIIPKTKERSASTKRKFFTAESVNPLIGNGTYGAGLAGHF